MQVHDLCISSQGPNVPNGPMLLMIWVVKADVHVNCYAVQNLDLYFQSRDSFLHVPVFNDQRAKIQARDSQRKSHVEVPGTVP